MTYCLKKTSRLQNVHQDNAKWALGFSMVEVLVAITLLMIMIVPAMNALTESVLAAGIHKDEASKAREIQNKMEEILARSFIKLDNDAFGKNSSNTTPITLPLATPTSDMDDSGYSDNKYDVFIFRCSKNVANMLAFDNTSANVLCIQIKQKNSSVVLLQSIKTS
jgi:Tfp pilus assembly protein PilV